MKGLKGRQLALLQTLTVLTKVTVRLVQNLYELSWFLQLIAAERFKVRLRPAFQLFTCPRFSNHFNHYDHYLCGPNFLILMHWLCPTVLLL